MPHKKDEHQWLNDIARGDRQKQRWLFEKYVAAVYHIAYRYTGNVHDSEEISSDVFRIGFTKIHQFEWRGAGSLKAWLCRIAVNQSLKKVQSKLQYSGTILTEENEYETAVNEALNKMGYDELLQHITRLPIGYRTVFNMFFIEGYSHKEIGELLQISEETSRSQLFKARKQLQKMIRHERV